MKLKALLSLLLAGLMIMLPACNNKPNSTTTTTTTTTAPEDIVVEPLAERPPTVGVFAEFFKGTDCKDFVGSKIISQIDDGFAQGTSPYSGTGRTNYSIRYSGQILAPQSGEYTFTTVADDGAVLTIGDTEVIRDAGPHFAEEHTGTITLEKGTYYPFTLEYYNGDLGGSIQLSWTPPGGRREVIPAESLFLPRSTSATPSSSRVNGRAIRGFLSAVTWWKAWKPSASPSSASAVVWPTPPTISGSPW